jgi:hypothetical protein
LREAGAEAYIRCNSVIIDDTSFACEGRRSPEEI